VQVIAAKYGSLEGEGLVTFGKVIDAYKAEYPATPLFDFNKLGRMATSIIETGKVPPFNINGARVPMSELYTRAGAEVARAFDPASLSYPWMADRWARRGKESVELIDVIAQQTAEGRGPIVELQKTYPDKKITVDVTGAAGDHEHFIYAVEGVGRFNSGSDGVLAAYTGAGVPHLFSATIGALGNFDLQIPAPGTVKSSTWPRQTTYATGDVVDVKFLDPNAASSAVEGQPFDNPAKILMGKIEGYDATGNYQVSYTKPDGTVASASIALTEIERANDPHDFKLTGSRFYDVNVDLATQPHLAQFLADAQPIIDKHLPKGGTLAMTADQLAKAQRECVAALIAYSEAHFAYPDDLGPSADEASKKYHALTDNVVWPDSVPLDALIEIGRGVCRHQCILHQLLMQTAGIDSRIAIGAANTDTGAFRGFHAWNELSLADNGRALSDLTWSDATISLWNGAYDVDKRRKELYEMTSTWDGELVG